MSQSEIAPFREENHKFRAALEKIAFGPWPEDVDTAEKQVQFDDVVACTALGVDPAHVRDASKK